MYKFHLESVLNYKESVEKNYIHEMLELQNDMAKEEKVLSKINRKAREILEHFAKNEKRGVSSDEVSMQRSFLKYARAKIAEQETKIADIKSLIEKKRPELLKASKEKKVLEKLKEKDRRKYFLKVNKKEQKIMDDIASKRSLVSQ